MTVSYAMAPPSVGNMAVGFDILGHALAVPGDQIRATRNKDPGVIMGSVSGLVDRLPEDPSKNTAGHGVQKLLSDQQAQFGVTLDIHKGVALGSGMGGSASSAVAAVVAVNQLLEEPLDVASLLPYALAGEAVASGAVHGDNVAPSLFGGIVMIPPDRPQRYARIPVPDFLHCVLVRPHIRLDTSSGRSLLCMECALPDVVTQTANLASLIAACYQNDIDALKGVFNDVLIEPQRYHQIKGFDQVKAAAMQAGALGFSISGSGPSMVAWCHSSVAEKISDAMTTAVSAFYPDYEHLISTVDAPGAGLISREQWQSERG